VQCYFRPFNDNNFWRENELIEYSEPIEVLPNEYKMVMDYVVPYRKDIYKQITDGYALVNCIVLNKNAACFAQ